MDEMKDEIKRLEKLLKETGWEVAYHREHLAEAEVKEVALQDRADYLSGLVYGAQPDAERAF